MSAPGARGLNFGRGLFDVGQPPVSPAQLSAARGTLRLYRVMAFLTGIVLLSGCVALILKYGTSLHMEPGTGYLWVLHGWLFLVYVVVTASLGYRLHWPLPRYLLVMLAGTIPTASFVAEHFVNGAVRRAASGEPGDQPVSVRD